MNIRRVMAVAVVAAATAATMSATSAGPVAAEQRSSEQTSGVMIVLDVSGSMADPDMSGTIKLDGAKQAITALLDELPPTSTSGCGPTRQPGPTVARRPPPASRPTPARCKRRSVRLQRTFYVKSGR